MSTQPPSGDGASDLSSVDPDPVRVRAAELAAEMTRPLPGSRKVYVTGSRPDLRVPMREIGQADTPSLFGAEQNPPLYVYDTSGPYTDPDVEVDVRRGLAPIREAWIEERGDTERLDGPSSAFGVERLEDGRTAALRFEHLRRPGAPAPGSG